jgi:outer membrane protein
MNSSWKIVAVSIVFSVLISMGIGYWLFGHRPVKSGYIITQNIFEGFKATKEVKVKFNALEKKQKAVLDSMATGIRFQEAKTPISDKEGQKNLLRSKQLYNRLAQEFQGNNKADEERYSREIWQQINQYTKDFGKKNGYAVIYGANGSGSIMYADTTLDITAPVLLYINERYEGKGN